MDTDQEKEVNAAPSPPREDDFPWYGWLIMIPLLVAAAVGLYVIATSWSSTSTELRSDGFVRVEETRWWFQKTVTEYRYTPQGWEVSFDDKETFSPVENNPHSIPR